ncbi:unnamed protein product [Caenorhabditis auriculariae]|uniref:long-chain-fatty-acid--CoA ligase n=1 Tax=Caenorhabditis auriculariae TaxID=2777116 RepID=A0A8S1GWA3_9PELO|nr:unnamed protein product [Caenorhabditis auriculariae]
MENTDINSALSQDRPFYLTILFLVMKLGFFLYDIVTYIPFKIFANPAEKLEKSQRVKAEPVKKGDCTSPWKNVKSKEGLAKSPFDGIEDLGSNWDECVRRYSDHACMGTREVLKVHKEKQKNGKVFEKWEMGNYHWRSFQAVDKRVNLLASGLEELGQKEKSPVVIFADTREEWMTTALACFKMNYPVATVYATLGEEAVCYAINQVEAETIFTSESLMSKVKKAISNGAKVKNVIYFDSVDPESKGESVECDEPFTLLSFEQLLSKGSTKSIKPKAKKDDIAMIMYTSGTTGNPKGVLLSHQNIVAATAGQGACITLTTEDRYIGYLPLAHILEVCAEMVVFSKGVRIGYSSAQTLFDRAPKIKKGEHGDCFALKPTLMACVPAVMDRIFKAVVDEVNANNKFFRELFKVCYERKRSRYEDGYSSIILNKLIFQRIGKLLGGNIRQILSGGAPLSPETQRFMNICFCCPVVQGYGLTETCGGGTLADFNDLSTGTVGPPLTCCEILLEEWKEAGYSPKNDPPQGEILIGGPNVAIGYYKNDEKTKEDFVMRNGKRYFATGDVGEFRADGSLKIIDRKKDLLKLSHGEYISLGKVETNLLTNPLVDNVCVYGDSDKSYLVALVVANQKNVSSLAESNGAGDKDFEEMCKDEKVVEAVQKELASYASSKLEKAEIPKKIFLCAEPWTPASGLLTEALKLKRKNIEKAFRKELDELYK